MVDSAHPSAAVGGKGPTVRRLKCYVSWVQYDVSIMACVVHYYMQELSYPSVRWRDTRRLFVALETVRNGLGLCQVVIQSTSIAKCSIDTIGVSMVPIYWRNDE